ncbi:hypothetical protein CC79DRAFT_1266920 [Sarocladium strictum]
MALKKAAGLGAQPSVVPVTKPTANERPRPVEVGWHPVAGIAGKWLAEDTGLGKMITDKINKYPDPTQHWAVLVGDYAHQLWMDENFDVIYTNEKVKREEWRTFEVGETRFNDYAVKQAGESVIASIREKTPAYNLITNNCQTYALQLLDAIKVGEKKEFGTTLAVYERLTGPGKVMDLFAGEHPQEEQQQDNSVSVAQHVMNENTTQLNPEEEEKKRGSKKSKKEKKKDAHEAKREVEADRRQDQKENKGGKEKKDVKDKLMSFFSRD